MMRTDFVYFWAAFQASFLAFFLISAGMIVQRLHQTVKIKRHVCQHVLSLQTEALN